MVVPADTLSPTATRTSDQPPGNLRADFRRRNEGSRPGGNGI